ncbi:hypothetical protein D3C87_1187540 [compost metagenome]
MNTGLVNVGAEGVKDAGTPLQTVTSSTVISFTVEGGKIVNVICFLSAAAVSHNSSELTPT